MDRQVVVVQANGRSRPLLRGLAEHVGKHGGLTDVDAFGGCQQNHRPHLRHLAEVFDGSGLQGLAGALLGSGGRTRRSALDRGRTIGAVQCWGRRPCTTRPGALLLSGSRAAISGPRGPEWGLRRGGRTPGRLLLRQPVDIVASFTPPCHRVLPMNRDLGPTTVGRRKSKICLSRRQEWPVGEQPGLRDIRTGCIRGRRRSMPVGCGPGGRCPRTRLVSRRTCRRMVRFGWCGGRSRVLAGIARSTYRGRW